LAIYRSPSAERLAQNDFAKVFSFRQPLLFGGILQREYLVDHRLDPRDVQEI
jgi:hypothetical protein